MDKERRRSVKKEAAEEVAALHAELAAHASDHANVLRVKEDRIKALEAQAAERARPCEDCSGRNGIFALLVVPCWHMLALVGYKEGAG